MTPEKTASDFENQRDENFCLTPEKTARDFENQRDENFCLTPEKTADEKFIPRFDGAGVAKGGCL